MKRFFDEKPSFTNRVRVIELGISGEECASLFKDQYFYYSPVDRQVTHVATRTSLQRVIGCSNLRGSYVRRATAHGIILFANLTILCVKDIANSHYLFSSFALGNERSRIFENLKITALS